MFARKRIARQAAGWLIEAQRPGFTLEDWQRLESWLSADARHRAAYRCEAKILGVAFGMQAPRMGVPGACAKVGSRVWRGIRTVLVTGLVLVFVFVGRPWNRPVGPAPVEYATRIGQLRNLLLSDGSQVHLNTNTTIRVRESRDRVQIELLSGEAAFNVVHDTRRPFIVSVSGTLIHDVGTNFVVRTLGAHDSVVFVSEGSVMASCPPRKTGFTRHEARLHSAVLEAGDEAIVSPGGIQTPKRLDSTEMARRLMWTQGMLEFRDEPLGKVVEELNRYRRRPLRIADPGLAAVRISAYVPVANVDEFEFGVREFGLQVRESQTRPGEVDLVRAR